MHVEVAKCLVMHMLGSQPMLRRRRTQRKGVACVVRTSLAHTGTPDGLGWRAQVSVVEMAKCRMIHKLGVQFRDLRIVDPQLGAKYPSTILVGAPTSVIVRDQLWRSVVGVHLT
jgi:hypothetical protein